MSSNKPVKDWKDLEGKFFKIDVGSTVGESKIYDKNNESPVLHYTNKGNIVFNGVQFCRQKKKAINESKCIVVHRPIPMQPREGYVYCFQGKYVSFKVDFNSSFEGDRIHIPNFIDSIACTVNNGYGLLFEIPESSYAKYKGSLISYDDLKSIVKSFIDSIGGPQLKLVTLVFRFIKPYSSNTCFIHITSEKKENFILNCFHNKYMIERFDADSINNANIGIKIYDAEQEKSIGNQIISNKYKLDADYNQYHHFGTFEEFQRFFKSPHLCVYCYRIKRVKSRICTEKGNEKIFEDHLKNGKKYFVLKRKKIGRLIFRNGEIDDLDSSNIYGKMQIRYYKRWGNPITSNFIDVFFDKEKKKFIKI